MYLISLFSGARDYHVYKSFASVRVDNMAEEGVVDIAVVGCKGLLLGSI